MGAPTWTGFDNWARQYDEFSGEQCELARAVIAGFAVLVREPAPLDIAEDDDDEAAEEDQVLARELDGVFGPSS